MSILTNAVLDLPDDVDFPEDDAPEGGRRRFYFGVKERDWEGERDERERSVMSAGEDDEEMDDDIEL
jgi:hypothetical protein